MGLGRICQSSY